MTKGFTECGDTIYYLAPDHFEPEKTNCGRLFCPKKECLVGINQLDNIKLDSKLIKQI